MDILPWIERKPKFGFDSDMLPFFLIRLEGMPVRAAAKVKGIDDAVLSARLNNKWSIKQNLGHLADIDKVTLKRIDEIVKGVEFMSPASIEAQDYSAWPIDKIIELLTANREARMKRYEQLTAKELKKSSLHPRLKVWMTPIDLAYFDAEHDDHHLAKVAAILRASVK